MVEVRGREVRTTAVDQKVIMSGNVGISLRVNQTVFLGCDNPMATSDGVTINLNSREVPRLVKPNDVLYLDDGKIILLVQDCEIVKTLTNHSIEQNQMRG